MVKPLQLVVREEMSAPQNNWNFGWPVAIAIVVGVGGILTLAAMDKLPMEIGFIKWGSPSPLPPAVNDSVDQPSIQPTSISLPPAEIIPSSSPSPTFERTGVVDDADGSSNLRSSPNLKSTILTEFPNGTSVTILAESKNDSDEVWYRVQVGEKIGWMNEKIIRVD